MRIARQTRNHHRVDTLHVSGEGEDCRASSIRNEYGILPVLVVIQNDGDKAIRLDRLRATYNGTGGKVRRWPKKSAICAGRTARK